MWAAALKLLGLNWLTIALVLGALAVGGAGMRVWDQAEISHSLDAALAAQKSVSDYHAQVENERAHADATTLAALEQREGEAAALSLRLAEETGKREAAEGKLKGILANAKPEDERMLGPVVMSWLLGVRNAQTPTVPAASP